MRVGGMSVVGESVRVCSLGFSRERRFALRAAWRTQSALTAARTMPASAVSEKVAPMPAVAGRLPGVVEGEDDEMSTENEESQRDNAPVAPLDYAEDEQAPDGDIPEHVVFDMPDGCVK